jgi:AraC-like DNA-binding protein
MDDVAGTFGMHRRTLDRHLQKHGLHYGELVASVEAETARQLLRETDMQVQQVAESLHYSSAANFATAFRRWTGMTPSEYRRQPR